MLLSLEPSLCLLSFLWFDAKGRGQGGGQERIRKTRKVCLRGLSQSLIADAYIMLSDYKSISKILNTIFLLRKRISVFSAYS